MYSKADLHIHTNASDGKFTPDEIIHLAKSQGIDLLAITDHDTVGALKEGIECGIKNGIKVIPGIELSTLYKGNSIHVLGYFKSINYENERFTNYLQEMTDFRLRRAEEMVKNLDKYFNIKLNYKEMLENAQGVVARPHIASAIIKAGYPYDWNYIFHNLIGEKSPAYVPNKKLSTKDGVNFLKSVNALTVLAHPVLIKNIEVQELLQFGFDGIEAIYYMNTESETENLINFAEEHNLIITAGSDFHGISKDDGSHADKVGSVYLDSARIHMFLQKLYNE